MTQQAAAEHPRGQAAKSWKVRASYQGPDACCHEEPGGDLD